MPASERAIFNSRERRRRSFLLNKEKEQHAQCCSCGTLDAAQVAPQRCLILHLRESNYIIFDY